MGGNYPEIIGLLHNRRWKVAGRGALKQGTLVTSITYGMPELPGTPLNL